MKEGMLFRPCLDKVFFYIHKKEIFTIQITRLIKLNTTILLGYPGEQTTMTTPGPFNINLNTTVGLSSDATTYICETKQLVLNFFTVILTHEFWAGQNWCKSAIDRILRPLASEESRKFSGPRN